MLKILTGEGLLYGKNGKEKTLILIILVILMCIYGDVHADPSDRSLLSTQDITAVKQSLDTIVPTYLSWTKEIIKLFL